MSPPERSPALERLGVLVGEWDVHMAMPADPGVRVRGRTSFEWLGLFLVQRSEVADPRFPDGISVIGYDPGSETCEMHYFDSRGVARMYTVSLIDRVWRVWREDPGFWQRFSGTLNDDGTAITGAWEKCMDASTWEHDFDLTYTRLD